MATTGVARRYAQAVIQIAVQDDDLDVWSRDLRVLRSLLNDPATRLFLESPAVPIEEKLQRVATETAAMGTKQRNFANVLVESRRTALIDDIVDSYDAELDRLRGVAHAQVTTAIALSDEEQTTVARRLESITGRRIVLTTAVDPAILGGFVARIGDQLIDASVVQRLNALRESLTA